MFLLLCAALLLAIAFCGELGVFGLPGVCCTFALFNSAPPQVAQMDTRRCPSPLSAPLRTCFTSSTSHTSSLLCHVSYTLFCFFVIPNWFPLGKKLFACLPPSFGFLIFVSFNLILKSLIVRKSWKPCFVSTVIYVQSQSKYYLCTQYPLRRLVISLGRQLLTRLAI